MAKQTFTTGQVLTAAQMTSLQETAMLGGVASAKTTSYTLVSADAGTLLGWNSTSAGTFTINSSVFSTGDTVTIVNQNSGTLTIAAGTATVNKPANATLALVQNAAGILHFTSQSAATFLPFDVGSNVSAPNFTLLGTGLTTSGSTVTVSGLGGYSTLYIILSGFSAAASANYDWRLNGDSGSNYYRAGTYFAFGNAANPYTIPQNYSPITSAQTSILAAIGGGAADEVYSGFIRIDGANSSGKKMFFQNITGARTSGSATQYSLQTVGYYDSASVISSFSLIVGGTTFDAGSYVIYGSA